MVYLGSRNTSLAGKRIVLLASDGALTAALLPLCQEAELAVVGCASNGKDAVGLMLKERPDIVLADVELPVLEALEAAQPSLTPLRLCWVFLTTFSKQETLEQTALIGCHGCASKPVDAEDLIACIREAYSGFQELDADIPYGPNTTPITIHYRWADCPF